MENLHAHRDKIYLLYIKRKRATYSTFHLTRKIISWKRLDFQLKERNKERKTERQKGKRKKKAFI